MVVAMYYSAAASLTQSLNAEQTQLILDRLKLRIIAIPIEVIVSLPVVGDHICPAPQIELALVIFLQSLGAVVFVH
jgi:hypothetical protein